MSSISTDPPRVVGVRAGRSEEPSVSSPTPALSWRTETARSGWLQAWAEIELLLGGGSQVHRLEGRDSVMVAWPFTPLPGLSRAAVRVRVGGTDGSASEWSLPLVIATGPWDFGSGESFITVPGDESDAATPHLYRTLFDVPEQPVRATLTLSGHGSHEATLNGLKVGDEWLAPGWTPYSRRLLHRSHDVTQQVRVGSNLLGIEVAPGWFGERYGFFGRTNRGSDGPLTVIARLTLEMADGSVTTVHSSPAWQGRLGGPVVSASIYHGEDYDARLAPDMWDSAHPWATCTAVAVDPGVLETATAAPVRIVETLKPIRVWTTPQGHTLADFGENCVGVVELTVAGPAGHTLTVRQCEELEHGEPAYGPLRTARATDTYTLAGGAPETWHPRFTFHGFRYAELIDWPGEVRAEDLKLLVLATDQRRIGTFQCSNPLVTQLFDNGVRSWRGNSLAVPTDCPQRDERLGWTGDLQVFVPAASSMFDVSGILASWLRDVHLEQEASGGSVPVIVPAVMSGHDHPVAGWGDVATVAPWTLYHRFGDLPLLAAQFDSMRAWVDRVLDAADDDLLWSQGMQIGDHLAPTASSFFPGAAPTSNVLIASAYLFRSLDIVAEAAMALGRDADAETYSALRERCRSSILAEFTTPRGRTVSDSITSYAMLIVFGIADADSVPAMGARLAELVAEIDFRIGTGFLGTPLVMDALAATGHLDTAARLLTQTRCPSWLYPVTQGATTVWERWDTKLPDGTVSAEDMASFNHYALGAVTDWLQRSLAGLDSGEPGYRDVRIAPTPLPGFDDATTTIETPYGPTTVGWRRDGGAIEVEAVVPPNATATVQLPDGSEARQVGAGTHRWRCTPAPPADAPIPGEVTLDSTLDRLVRDAGAREAIQGGLIDHDPQRAHVMDELVKWTPGVPLHAALMFAHPAGLAAVTQALADLTASRQGSPRHNDWTA